MWKLQSCYELHSGRSNLLTLVSSNYILLMTVQLTCGNESTREIIVPNEHEYQHVCSQGYSGTVIFAQLYMWHGLVALSM